MINCEIIKKVKYRATTARSSFEWVRPPMYCYMLLVCFVSTWYEGPTLVNHRMMMGKKKPNKPEIAGGKTPEIKVKE